MTTNSVADKTQQIAVHKDHCDFLQHSIEVWFGLRISQAAQVAETLDPDLKLMPCTYPPCVLLELPTFTRDHCNYRE